MAGRRAQHTRDIKKHDPSPASPGEPSDSHNAGSPSDVLRDEFQEYDSEWSAICKDRGAHPSDWLWASPDLTAAVPHRDRVGNPSCTLPDWAPKVHAVCAVCLCSRLSSTKSGPITLCKGALFAKETA